MYYPIRRARIPGFDIDELTRLYQRAVKVERLTFRLQDKVGIVSMGDKGNNIDIRFSNDISDNPENYLSVTSDSKEFVDSSYTTLLEIADKYKCKTRWARSEFTKLAIQLIGVTFIFIVCVWLTDTISPRISPNVLDEDKAYFMVFLFVFLLLSNSWGVVYQYLMSTIHRLFPNIAFYREKDSNTAAMTVFLGVVSSMLFLIIYNVWKVLAILIDSIFV
jgi:hypothetical protein